MRSMSIFKSSRALTADRFTLARLTKPRFVLPTMTSKTPREVIATAMLRKGVSPEGRDWLTLALDPFHDYEHPVAGYPDSDSSHTTVSCFQYAMDISKPAGAIGNWDAHILTMPYLGQTSLYQHVTGAGRNDLTLVGGMPQIAANAFNVIKVDAGQPLWPQANGVWNPTNLEEHHIDMATDGEAGISRVIGYAFEVVNTTADVYKQGALTAYRLPQTPTLGTYITVDGANHGSVNLCQCYRNPPASPKDALLLGGTRQWAAADGAYLVVPFSSVNNPLTASNVIDVMLSADGGWPHAGDHVLTRPMGPAFVVNNLPVATPQLGLPLKPIPFNTTGVMLTGLSNSSTFRLKVKMYVERAPSFTESSLAVLATPSAPYDAKVLALYSSIIHHLPIAVPVRDNDAGDWWRAILEVVATVAPMIGTAIAPGAGTGVGAAISTAAGIASKLIRSSAPRRPATARPAPMLPAPQPKQQQRSQGKKAKTAGPAIARRNKVASMFNPARV